MKEKQEIHFPLCISFYKLNKAIRRRSVFICFLLLFWFVRIYSIILYDAQTKRQ